MAYTCSLVVLMSIYGLLAMSLNIVVGTCGLLSLCHAAFYAIGAYTTGLLMVEAQWPFMPALGGAIVLCCAVALTLGWPAVRLRGDSFVLASLAIQIVVVQLLRNWESVTNGLYGVSGIPRPVLFGLRTDSPASYALFAVLTAGLCALLLVSLLRSPFCRLVRAVRDDEVAAAALGHRPQLVRLTVFVLAAGFAAVAGALYAGFASYVDTSSFVIRDSLFILSLVLIGGPDSPLGPLMAAALLTLLPEALKAMSLSESMAAGINQMVYGTALVVLMRVLPRGLMGATEPQ